MLLPLLMQAGMFTLAMEQPVFAAVLIPVAVPRPYRPMDWSWLQQAYNEALVEARMLGETDGFIEAIDEANAVNLDEWNGLDPDPSLMGRRKKKQFVRVPKPKERRR